MAVPASRAVAWYGEAMRLFKRGPVVLSALGALTIVAQVAIDLWPDAGPLLSKIVVPLILSHGEGGHVVNTSSMAGIVPLPLPGLGAYQTAKFAVRGFTESLRMSLARHGIGVSCLFPGGVRTRIVEAGAPDEAARAAAREMTASWMDPVELGAYVIEGIRNNAPYILTHSEFRDEVRELYEMLDAAFPRNQQVPAGRQAFEDQRRAIIREFRGLPVKD